MSKQLFFIAILPPLDIQQSVNEIKHHFVEVYNSKAALKSPPHITLQPPFYWQTERLDELTNILKEFTNQKISFPVVLEGFAAFKPWVIYVDVHKTPELMKIQKELMDLLEASLQIAHKVSKTRPFAPHMTVGFKDLTKANFYKAWSEFEGKQFDAKFTATRLTLLQFKEKKWKIDSEFYF